MPDSSPQVSETASAGVRLCVRESAVVDQAPAVDFGVSPHSAVHQGSNERSHQQLLSLDEDRSGKPEDASPPTDLALALADPNARLSDADEQSLGTPDCLHIRRFSTLEEAIKLTLTEDDEVIPEIVTEIETAFQRALLYLALDEGPSVARQRKILEKLTPEDFHSGERIDDAVRVRVGMELKSGIFDLFTNDELPPDDVLASAIANAYLALPPPTPGRPSGTESLAVRQLARELARIWSEYSGKMPTRSVSVNNEGLGHREGGAFHGFIGAVMTFAPEGLLKPRKGAIPKIDNFVRLAQAELDAALASGSELEARGFLNETDWLGKPAR